MKKNIGIGDRIVRIILGLVCLVGAYLVTNFYLQIGLVVLGLFCFYEALVSWCAFYALIGRNTCPVE